METNILELYRNYLYALEERKEYNDKYGDTEELIMMYEEKIEKSLNKKLLIKNN